MKVNTHNRKTRKWLARIATGLAVLAVAIPAAPALGSIPPEPSQPPAQVFVDLPKGLTADPVAVEPLRDGPLTGARPVETTVDRADSSFDWGDAAIGLGIGMAASILLALGVTGVQRRRGTLANA